MYEDIEPSELYSEYLQRAGSSTHLAHAILSGEMTFNDLKEFMISTWAGIIFVFKTAAL